MARTTTTLVQALLQDDYGLGADLNPYVDTATLIVSRVSTCASLKGLGLSSTELEMIERWLAAHFYVMSDQVVASKSTNGASGSFQGQTGMSLDASKYGQAAMNVDYSGCLTAIAKRQFAGGFWIGKRPSEQIPYRQRD